jgi:hypothetical protein
MTIRAHARWLLALAFCLPHADLRAADVGWTTVAVRVYNGDVVPHADEERALVVAAAVLAPADIAIRWVHCHGGPAHPSRCGEPPSAGEVSVRLVRSPVPAGYAGTLALGEALVEPRRGAGSLATIHVDRVAWLAQAGASDAVTLLGRAIAHELVHLIAGSGTHASQGLMRPIWSSRDVARNRAADWSLGRLDGATLRARLARQVATVAAR